MPSSPPERPFIRRLMIEIWKVSDGLPAAADEIGIPTDTIESLTHGIIPSPDILDTISAWLAARIPLTTQEIQDLEQMKRASSSKEATQLAMRSPGVLTKITRPTARVSTPLTAIIAAAIFFVVIGILAGLGISSLVNPGSNGTEAAPDAEASSATSPASAVSASPSPSTTSGSAIAIASPTQSASPSATTPLAGGINPSPSKTPAGKSWSGPMTVPYSDAEVDAEEYRDISQPPVPINTENTDQGDIEVTLLDSGPGSDTLNTEGLTTEAQIATWSSSSTPTYQQCKTDASAGGESSQSIDNPGDQFCIITSNGTVATLKLISKDYGNNYATFQTTIWWPANTGS